MSLKDKRARFAQEYLLDLNGTQAAIRAGYSPMTAKEQAYELLSCPAVVAEIERLKTERSAATGADAAWVLRRFVDEAEADIADLYDAETGELLPIAAWPLIWRQGLVQGVEVVELFEGKGAARKQVGVVRKVKLDSRVRRLELIGKHIGVQAFQEQIQVKGLEGLADRFERAHGRDTTPRVEVAGRDRRRSAS